MVEAFAEFLAAGAAEMQQVAGVPVTLRGRSGVRVDTTAVITVRGSMAGLELGGGQLRETGHALLPPDAVPEVGGFLDEFGGRVWYVAGAAFSPLGDGWKLELVRYHHGQG